MSIDEDTIKRGREIIAAASKPPYVVGTLAGDDHAAHVRTFSECLALAPDRLKCWTVVIPDGDTPIEEFSLSVAITGNGPTSEANAYYIKHSHDPVGGWAACLDEIELLQDELRTIRRVTSTELAEVTAQADAANRIVRDDWNEIKSLRALLGEARADVAAMIEQGGIAADDEQRGRDMLRRIDAALGEVR